MEFKVALAQMSSARGDVEGNLEKMRRFVEEAAASGAEIVVFPEMCLCGYTVMDGRDFETFHKCVQSLDSPPIRKLSRLSSKSNIHIVFGAPMEDPARKGVVYNSAVLLEPDGGVHVYNKIHLPTGRYGESTFYEHMYCKPGSELKLCETRLGRIGLQVCRDYAFPEVSRAYCYAGVDVIVNISAAPATSKRFFDIILPARALENSSFLVYVNAVGKYGDVEFFGGSRIINPLGETVVECKTGEEELAVGTISLEQLRETRTRLPILKDVQPPEFYNKLTRKILDEDCRQKTGKKGRP
ncbi:MAG: carbon-nitrogen hydrolase family protein [Candidatus Jordarchaeales archaeon]